MRIAILSGFLALSLAATAGAVEPKPITIETLSRNAQGLTEQLAAATDRIAALEKRLDTVEQRLGESYRSVSPFTTVERRLDDLEKEVGNLNRR